MFLRKNKSAVSAASSDYQIVPVAETRQFDVHGWEDPLVVSKQDAAYASLIERANRGDVRIDLQVAAKAITATGLSRPTVVEVGSGSGYYSEIFSLLLHDELQYTGLDFSLQMLQMARKKYPSRIFVCADGSRLPFQSDSFDIVLNGNALMHMRNYEEAIRESRRVSRAWCIFHTVPILSRRATTMIQKTAYGGGVFEWIFNEGELLILLNKHGLRIHTVYESIPYNLENFLKERTVTKTYLCEVVR